MLRNKYSAGNINYLFGAMRRVIYFDAIGKVINFVMSIIGAINFVIREKLII
jgi:hypothetical protein